jgi:hypothetical protein
VYIFIIIRWRVSLYILVIVSFYWVRWITGCAVVNFWAVAFFAVLVAGQTNVIYYIRILRRTFRVTSMVVNLNEIFGTTKALFIFRTKTIFTSWMTSNARLRWYIKVHSYRLTVCYTFFSMLSLHLNQKHSRRAATTICF